MITHLVVNYDLLENETWVDIDLDPEGALAARRVHSFCKPLC